MATSRIPLFPLEVVLFPGASLRLHIFEPRYKQMVERCLETSEEFGVIMARAEGIAPVGCTAAIVEVLKKYEDGRMDILTVGESAFRLTDVFEDKPYLEGLVEALGDDDTGEISPQTEKRLMELYENCHSLVYGQPAPEREENNSITLAFEIAHDLPLDLEFKQQLLEMRAESERQKRLLARLTEWLPKLARLGEARVKAAGNGHGPH